MHLLVYHQVVTDDLAGIERQEEDINSGSASELYVEGLYSILWWRAAPRSLPDELKHFPESHFSFNSLQ